MEKVITVGGKPVPFKATGSTVRKYRQEFARDLFVDIGMIDELRSSGKPMTGEALNCFENIAYIMAKQADPNIESTPDAWLDNFEMFNIYNILPQLLDLWQLNSITTAASKKK